MNVGMLWFDNDPKTDLATKISRAADYYRQKYGLQPNQCFVNPSMVNGTKVDAPVNVQTSPSILPNHLWIGYNAAVKQAEPSG